MKDLKQGDQGNFVIIESGSQVFPMKYTLHKTRLTIEDEDGNKIAIDKRKGRIVIQRWGDVDWHRKKED